jgi:hypothetical protein
MSKGNEEPKYIDIFNNVLGVLIWDWTSVSSSHEPNCSPQLYYDTWRRQRHEQRQGLDKSPELDEATGGEGGDLDVNKPAVGTTARGNQRNQNRVTA